VQPLTCDAAMVDQRPRYRDGWGIGEEIDVGPFDRQNLIGSHSSRSQTFDERGQ
jgi:hypothetical protein